MLSSLQFTDKPSRMLIFFNSALKTSLMVDHFVCKIHSFETEFKIWIHQTHR